VAECVLGGTYSSSDLVSKRSNGWVGERADGSRAVGELRQEICKQELDNVVAKFIRVVSEDEAGA
jgi:hypothetical protein